MNTKMMGIFTGMLLAFLVIVAPQQAFSQTAPVQGAITKVDQAQNGVFITVVPADPALTRDYFIPNNSAVKKEQLAIALTALSTGQPVLVVFNTTNFAVARISVLTQ